MYYWGSCAFPTKVTQVLWVTFLFSKLDWLFYKLDWLWLISTLARFFNSPSNVQVILIPLLSLNNNNNNNNNNRLSVSCYLLPFCFFFFFLLFLLPLTPCVLLDWVPAWFSYINLDCINCLLTPVILFNLPIHCVVWERAIMSRWFSNKLPLCMMRSYSTR